MAPHPASSKTSREVTLGCLRDHCSESLLSGGRYPVDDDFATEEWTGNRLTDQTKILQVPERLQDEVPTKLRAEKLAYGMLVTTNETSPRAVIAMS